MDTIPSEMLRGHVDTIILLSLLDCDKHTSQIKEEIESRVDGQFELKQGTFYSCIQRITSQGYVMEYRSSSVDGKRRKYYQLTEKGKAYIEDNKDKWLFSRNVIDTLIQVPQDDAPIDSVYSFSTPKTTTAVSKLPVAQQVVKTEEPNESTINTAKTADLGQNNSVSPIESDINENTTSSKLQEINNDKLIQVEDSSTETNVVDDNISELEKFLSGQFEESAIDNSDGKEIIPEKIEVEKQKIIENDVSKCNSNTIIEEATTTSNEPDLFDYMAQKEAEEKAEQAASIAEQNQKIEKEKEIASSKNIDINNNFEQPNQNEISYKNTVNYGENSDDFDKHNNQRFVQNNWRVDDGFNNTSSNSAYYENDFYDGEESVSHNYKDVLTKLFQTKNEPLVIKEHKQEEVKTETVNQENVINLFETAKPVVQEQIVEEQPPIKVIRTEKKPPQRFYKAVQKSKIIPEKIENIDELKNNKNSKYDFSEIYALADREGFKVKTSSSYAKKDIGKILINKLVANSAIMFYILVVAEIILLAYTTHTVANIPLKAYYIVCAVLAVFPIIALITYFIDPKRKLDSIASFKSVISLVLIIALNISLIVIVYAILTNIDFTSQRDILVRLLYPLVVILNLPIYFFIKYLKLENQKYFS